MLYVGPTLLFYPGVDLSFLLAWLCFSAMHMHRLATADALKVKLDHESMTPQREHFYLYS